MSLLERIDARDGEEEIEQGKRLIRVGDDRGVALGDWLGFRLNRIARLLPSPLRLRPQRKVRLLTVPKDPVAGDKSVGEALLQGTLIHGRERIALERLDFADTSLSPAFRDYLQSFAWLRDLAAAATRDKGARLAERLAQQWLAAYAGEAAYEHEDRPDLWGRRILFWTAYAPYILSAHDVGHRAALLKALARGARYLDRSADRAQAGLPRVTAWAGVVAAALLVEGGAARLRHGETGLGRALAGAMHDDGGLVSRSPAEQLALVEILGQIRAIYYAGRREMPERIAEALPSSVAALLAVTLGDEALSSWQGGNMASKRRVAAAVEGAAVRSRPLRQARGWGYQWLSAKSSIAVFDGAPPPPAAMHMGSCASTLAFEFSDGGHRIVVNCGGEGGHGALPRDLAHALRFTAAHSTLTLADRNSTAILGGGGLGRGVTQVELSRDETGGASRVEASHDGYVRRHGLVHQRELVLAADGNEVRGEDRLVPQRRRRRTQSLPFAARFHLGPQVEAARTADGQGALLRVRGGSAWHFRCRGGRLDIEDSLWVDAEGVPRPTRQLVITGETPPDGISISWLFRRAG